jgi:hypothetical protein
MIERNLGNIERLIRLLIGLAFAYWVFTQPYLNAIEWFVMAVSLMLILNGVFSRCFIWWMLGINTSDNKAAG